MKKISKIIYIFLNISILVFLFSCRNIGVSKSSYEEFVGKIKDSTDSFNILWASDFHYQRKNSEYGVSDKYLDSFLNTSKIGNIKFSIITGDVLNGYYDKLSTINDYYELRSKLDLFKNIYFLKGNHDDDSWYFSNQEYNSMDSIITTKDLSLEYFNLQNEYYYYLDFPEDKIRCIMINTVDLPYDIINNKINYYGMWKFGIQEKQLSWLINEALNVEKNFRIIIFEHNPTISYDGLYNKMPTNSELFTKIIEDYNMKQSNSINSNAKDFNVDLSYDFTSANGNVIAVFFGHIHKEVECFINSIFYKSIINAYDKNGSYNIISINNNNNNIKLISYMVNDNSMKLKNYNLDNEEVINE